MTARPGGGSLFSGAFDVTPVPKRRTGAESSRTRAELIQAAVHILRDEGASAVTARRLADKVGLQRHIVHYYFGTMEQVFVAVMREEGARSEQVLREAAKTGDALVLLWDNIRQSAAVILELMRLAIRHPSIAGEYKIYTERFRHAMAGILEIYARSHGIVLPTSPGATAVLLQALASLIAIEASLGLATGHDDAEAALLGWLKQHQAGGASSQSGLP
ncbi:TetR/AcrR family transcriptional regulator [Novosphingobium sp. G106]|uniref:TetR/AcrR family transcriptional regulator n=1 Tax=Novosphingobium sp. G106 TaxID=2849500 RepID=UPI001C2D1FD6|nr:TetR family transcriptional regulator [Novosphingobium sp. G106]MBV1687801.1 TetR/AcrR family transcriptional regulator [Novosphingobium sp. G106]